MLANRCRAAIKSTQRLAFAHTRPLLVTSTQSHRYMSLKSTHVAFASKAASQGAARIESEDGQALPEADVSVPPSRSPFPVPNANMDQIHTLLAMVRTFRISGHLVAKVDPLKRGKKLEKYIPKMVNLLSKADDPAAALREYGITLDIDQPLHLGAAIQYKPTWTPRELYQTLVDVYCTDVGVEVAHIPSSTEKKWLRSQFEFPNSFTVSPQEQRQNLRNLIRADLFETFLKMKYKNTKRFGLEGCSSLIPALDAFIHSASDHGVKHVELGMAHRGRLNVLANVLNKPLELIFSEFADQDQDVGDVKYHLGSFANYHDLNLTVSLSPNPSHLELVDPVVMGRTRAKQEELNDLTKTQVAGLLIHGDAAFSGLGIVGELSQLSRLPGFSTGGMIHVIVNNQIGFTTSPHRGRTTHHPTDMAKGLNIPIFHVSADNPDAVSRCMKIVTEWRQVFQKDCVVDIVGYRRHGHNEGDDPSITQPLMYKQIDQQEPVLSKYQSKLINAGVVTEDEVTQWRDEYWRSLHDAFHNRVLETDLAQWTPNTWQLDILETVVQDQPLRQRSGVPVEKLKQIAESINQFPPHLTVHHKVVKVFRERQLAVKDNKPIDWATAEALAFASLIDEGRRVRLTGQDSERGTFNQRHAVVLDQETEDFCIPINNVSKSAAHRLHIYDSSLSELAVAGYEYGYDSVFRPSEALVLWEAQFGDFANGAQPFIDTFIANSMTRWHQKSSMVMLLPHGFEGQGPDHSSARLERFLQLVNDDPDFLPGCSPSQQAELERVFRSLDRDNSGNLGKQDVRRGLKHLGMNVDVDGLFASLDVDGNNKINLREWLHGMSLFAMGLSRQPTNITIVQPSTPAQYFHALRRQVIEPALQPLIMLTPKFLLHHNKCRSYLWDMGEDSFFQHAIVDYGPRSQFWSPDTCTLGNVRELSASELKTLAPEDGGLNLALNSSTDEEDFAGGQRPRRVILCSGKVYFTLRAARKSKKLDKDIALVRLEQLCPFPYLSLSGVMQQWPPSSTEYLWVQEEPKNQGAWSFIRPRFYTLVRELFPDAANGDVGCTKRSGTLLRYVGREAAAAATGSYRKHVEEQSQFVTEAMDVDMDKSLL